MRPTMTHGSFRPASPSWWSTEGSPWTTSDAPDSWADRRFRDATGQVGVACSKLVPVCHGLEGGRALSPTPFGTRIDRKRPAPRRDNSIARRLSQRAHKAAAARFTRRVTDLVLASVAAGRLTRKLEHATLAKKNDIDSARTTLGLRGMRAISSTLTRPPNGTWTCSSGDLIMISRGRLCLLVGCDPQYRKCSSVCFRCRRTTQPAGADLKNVPRGSRPAAALLRCR